MLRVMDVSISNVILVSAQDPIHQESCFERHLRAALAGG